MGIKGLGPWLKKNANTAIHTIDLSLFSGQRVAVDASIYLYRFICIANSDKGNFFDMFLNFIQHLRKKNIRPVFVFDGPPPKQKDRTKEKRRQIKEKLKDNLQELETLINILEETKYDEDLNEDIQKRVDSIFNESTIEQPRRKILTQLYDKHKKIAGQCITITKEQIRKIKDLLDCLGLPWIQSEYEAEKTCSWLCRYNYVKAVITADTDVLAYGADIWLSDVKTGDNTCKLIRYEDILAVTGFSSERFTEFCIMCGTDYNDNIPNIGPAKAFNLLKNCDLDELSKTMDTAILFYEDAKKLFTLPPDIPDFEIPNIKEVCEDLELLLLKNNSRYTPSQIKSYKGEFVIL